MKKSFVIICFTLLICIFNKQTYATENIIESTEEKLNVSSFIAEAQKYTSKTFDNLDLSEVLKSAISGNIDNSKITHGLFNILGIEIRNQIYMIISILIIIVIHSILKSISEGLENEGISKISYFVQYILIISLIMNNFSEIVVSIKETIGNLVGFSYSLIPLLLSLMIFTGKIITVSTIQPILLFLINIIATFISSFILPLVLIGTSLGIISKISDRVQVDKLSKMFKSSVVWILGFILTIFTGVLSLESSLTGHVDNLTVKTTKTVVTTAVPVVGKILSDTTEVILGSGIVLKNAIGFVGVIVIIGICIGPIIRLSVLSIIYSILSAVCQPIADKKIIDILEQMKDTFKMLLAIISTISVMLIIGITIVIKISGI